MKILPVLISLFLFTLFALQGELVGQMAPPRLEKAADVDEEVVPAAQKDEDEMEDGDEKETGDQENTSPPVSSAEQMGDQDIRLTLWDGTIVSGEIQIESLRVKTQFGELDVPIRNIVNLRPGLDSLPQVSEKIVQLIENLGDRNFQVRESAHKELVAMGTSIRNALVGMDGGGSAERKKHLDKIRTELDELAQEEEDWDEADDEEVAELIQGDTIQTRDFTIVGKVLQEQFILRSKYGELTIALADIKTGDRSWLRPVNVVNRTVSVEGNAFFQTTPANTKIRVQKGDRIRIRASGSINWASWGNINTTPNGITNQGTWESFNCGTLVARLGSKGKYIKIGEKAEIVAKEAGVLYLGVAMRDNFARQDHHQWPGGYKARITVTPATSEIEEDKE